MFRPLFWPSSGRNYSNIVILLQLRHPEFGHNSGRNMLLRKVLTKYTINIKVLFCCLFVYYVHYPLVSKIEGKRLFERYRCRWDNIKMDINEAGGEV